MFSGMSLIFALCFTFFTWAGAQECPSQCKCPDVAPQCPQVTAWSWMPVGAAVFVLNSWVSCALREMCVILTKVSIVTMGHQTTDESESAPGAPCVFGGNVYRSGESFQSSCKYQCTCLDGAVGCVPLCGMDVRLPSPDCPMPRRVKVPGKCCEEWVCDSPPTTNSFMGSFLPAYRKEETYGPDPSIMRENCLVQTTEWSACSKTCGLGISTRVTNDNRECRLEKQSRLCMVRPCESHLEEKIKKGKKCIRTPRVSKPMKFEVSGCTTTKAYRPKFCGVCTDGRCCTPHRTTTLPVEFKCPDGQIMKKQMMVIKTCACHYNCPSENDIFESLYYKKMHGDTA